MAEFKKLSAVEAVDTVSDIASVLIEEDGVIKRAPKSEVGGGMADIVFDTTLEYLATTSAPSQTCTLLNGDYATVIERIRSGKPISVIGRFTHINPEGVQTLYAIRSAEFVNYEEWDGGSGFWMCFDGVWYLLNTDNTIIID